VPIPYSQILFKATSNFLLTKKISSDPGGLAILNTCLKTVIARSIATKRYAAGISELSANLSADERERPLTTAHQQI
jgi:hypothetical protein